MFRTTLEQYLKVSVETRVRVELRRKLERITRPFNGRTGQHKAFVHLQTMFQLGLLQREAGSASRTYASEGRTSQLESLSRELVDVSNLDQRIARNEWALIADTVLRGTRASRPEMQETEVERLFLGVYARVSRTGVPLCSVSTLIDVLFIVLLAEGFQLKSHDDALQVLLALQKKHPKDVRFHVDRRGRLAFVKISSRMLAEVD